MSGRVAWAGGGAVAGAWIALLGALFVLGCAGAVGPAGDGGGAQDSAVDAPGAPGCEIAPGRVCPRGTSCPAGDGCNTCACSLDGRLACTLLDCAPVDAGPPACANSAQCAPGFECVFDPGCGTASGHCQGHILCDQPLPFCGCDGRTYMSCLPTQPFSRSGPCETIDGGPAVYRYPGARFTLQAPGGFAGTGPALSLGGDGIVRVWFNTSQFADPANPAPREDRSRALTAAQVNEAFDRLFASNLMVVPHPQSGGGGECQVTFYARQCEACAAREFTYAIPAQVLPELQPLWDWFGTVLRPDEALPGTYCGP